MAVAASFTSRATSLNPVWKLAHEGQQRIKRQGNDGGRRTGSIDPQSRAEKADPSLNFDKGAIKTPKSAIEGIVCKMPRLAKTKLATACLRKTSAVSGTPDHESKKNRREDKPEMAQKPSHENAAVVREFLRERQMIEDASRRHQ